jgi:hypothetical protein
MLGFVFIAFSIHLFGNDWIRAVSEKACLIEDIDANIRNVAHDLGPVLLGLKMQQKSLVRLLDSPADASWSSAARGIVSTSRLQLARLTGHLERTTEDLRLTLLPKSVQARPASGGENLALYLPFAMEQAVADARNRHQQSEGAKALTLRLPPSSDELFIYAQISHITRILANLIDNAIEATHRTSSPRIEISLSVEDETLSLRISDNGTGIDLAIEDQVFTNKFTTKKHHQGQGLASCQSLLQAEMGGSIIIDRDPRDGYNTTLLVTLPKRTRPPWAVTQITVRPDEHIVIIDDEEQMHDTWRARLKERFESSWTFLDSTGVRTVFPTVDCIQDPSELNGDMSRCLTSGTMFFVDFKLKNAETDGLSLIQDYGLIGRAYLVTNHFADPVLCGRAEAAGVQVIPKPFLFETKITIEFEAGR